jgi:hypothetical protein
MHGAEVKEKSQLSKGYHPIKLEYMQGKGEDIYH